MVNTGLPNGGPKQAPIISNVFLSPTISYSPLTANLTPKDTNSLDIQLINKNKPHFGLAPSDSAIALMRPTRNFGGGLNSFSALDLIANARELEVTLSSSRDMGKALRCILQLQRDLCKIERSEDKLTTEISTQKLAGIGIFLRDTSKPIGSIMTEVLLEATRTKSGHTSHNPMGHLHFRGEGHTTKTTLVSRDKNLYKFAIYGKHHNHIQDILDWHTENNARLSSLTSPAGWSRADKSLTDKFVKKGLATAFKNTIEMLEDATNKPAHFHEWRATKTPH